MSTPFTVTLKQGQDYPLTFTYKDGTGAAQDISGYIFEGNFLDGQGGAILATMTLAFVTDGTDGKLAGSFSDTDLADLITAGTLPKWFELWAETGGIRLPWLSVPVIVKRSGQ